MKKKPRSEERVLTETELELMNVLWKKGEASVNDVLGELPKERDLAYTSVSTILRILEQKKLVKARKEGRGHLYSPLLAKDEYEESSVRRLVTRVFDGTPTSLVKCLLETNDLSPDDLRAIRELIDSRSKA